MGDGDVVEELGTTQDKPLFPRRRLPQQLLRVVSENGHNQLIECFGFRGWTGVLAGAVALLGVKGGGLENYASFASAQYSGHISVCTDVDAFGFEIRRPVRVKVVAVGKCYHGWKIRQERFRIIVPELHVWIVE